MMMHDNNDYIPDFNIFNMHLGRNREGEDVMDGSELYTFFKFKYGYSRTEIQSL